MTTNQYAYNYGEGEATEHPQNQCGPEPIRRPLEADATRFATNRNWTVRGDNTKYKETK